MKASTAKEDFDEKAVLIAKLEEEMQKPIVANKKQHITAVEFDDLNKYQNMTITSVGDENFYFEWEGNDYYCKCL